MKFKFNAKNIVIFVIALILLFIPTYIAIFSYTRNAEPSNENSVSGTTVHTLTIQDPNKNSTVVTEDSSATSTWTVFDNMIKNATAVSEIPETVDKNGNMMLCTYTSVTESVSSSGTVSSDPESKSYSFYMSTDASACYFMAPDNKSYLIAENDASAFLQNTVANYLYKSAVIPGFTFLGKTVEPSSLNWNYLAAGNSYKTLTQTGSTELCFDYSSGTEFSWSFTQAPSSCKVKVTDSDGKSLYDAQLSGLSKVSLEKNTMLTFEISASWAKTDGCDAYGDAVYSFTADLTAPAVFRIASDSIYGGEFAVVSAINIKDTSKISFRSVPALPESPIFGNTGDSVTCLIPVSYGLEVGTSTAPKEYQLIFSYGNSEQTFTLKVNNYRYDYRTSSYTVSANLVNTNYTDAQISVYNNLVKSICSEESCSSALFSGNFLDYQINGLVAQKGLTLVQGFGRFIKVNGSDTKTFQHTGIDFSVSSTEKLDVPAMNSGIVCATGTDSVLGNYVVIDHGCGLRSWYAHLTDISVSVGDSIATGNAVGKTCSNGATGFTAEGRVHIGITIGNQAVAPYSLWESGVTLPSFY